jgi:hypothetical protein
VMGDPLNVQGSNGDFYARFERNRARFLAPGGDNAVWIDAAPGAGAYLSFGADGVADVMRIGPGIGPTKYAVVELSGMVPLRMYATPNGSPGEAISVGVDENSAVGTFAVGSSHPSVKGLVVRGRADQSAPLVEIQTSDGSVLASVTPRGLHGWSAANELGANAVSSFSRPIRWLRVMGSDGVPLLIPAYREA